MKCGLASLAVLYNWYTTVLFQYVMMQTPISCAGQTDDFLEGLHFSTSFD